jgi:hypothetical protein
LFALYFDVQENILLFETLDRKIKNRQQIKSVLVILRIVTPVNKVFHPGMRSPKQYPGEGHVAPFMADEEIISCIRGYLNGYRNALVLNS